MIEIGQFFIPPVILGLTLGVLTWNVRVGATTAILTFLAWNWFLLTR
jgi:hypothetical protein